MPIRVVCPQCGKALNAPDTAAGKVANCPECKGKIPIPGRAAPVAPIVAQAARPAVPVPPPVAAVAPPIAVAKPVVLPAIPVGGPPTLPASSNPMAGFSLDDFGGSAEGGVVLGAQPLAASPLAAAPRTRRNVGNLMPLFIIAGAVLGAGILMGGIYWLTRGGGGGDWMKWMPDNSQFIVHAKMAPLLPYIEDMKRANPQMQREFDKLMAESGTSPDDFKSFSIGMMAPAGSGQQPPGVFVIQANRVMTDADMRKVKSTRTEQHGEYLIYHIENNQAACKVDDYTMVGGDPEMLKAVLSRNAAPKFSPALQKAIDQTSFSADFAVAASLQGLSPAGAGAMPMPGFDPTKLEGVSVTGDLGSSIDLSGTLLCVDSDTAAQLKTQADQMMQGFGGMVGMMSARIPAFRKHGTRSRSAEAARI